MIRKTNSSTMRLPSLERIEPQIPRAEEIWLAAQAKQGSRAAMERLLLAWQPMLLVEVAKIGGRIDQEELFQVSMLAAIEAVGQFDPGRGDSSALSFAMFLVRTRLLNCARDASMARRSAVRAAALAKADECEAQDPESAYLEAEGAEHARKRLSRLLSTLSEDKRGVLEARYLGARDETQAEFAKRVGINQATVCRREEKALAALARVARKPRAA